MTLTTFTVDVTLKTQVQNVINVIISKNRSADIPTVLKDDDFATSFLKLKA